ncbi:MAG: response regulator transcription factor [Nitrospirota bacterium]
MEKNVKILIVDDHTIFRQGLRALLEAQDGLQVVGEAENGRDAAKKAQELAPDVVIMDIAMPMMNGLEATRQIKRFNPDVKVLALTMYKDEEYVFQILKSGASGYLIKDASASELITAIRSVHSGNPYFSPVISRKIMDSYLREDEEKKTRGEPDKLTNREKEVLQLIAEGNTNNEIGNLMNISVKTVETHRAHIMSKLDIHDMAGLIKYAIRKGFVVLDTGR